MDAPPTLIFHPAEHHAIICKPWCAMQCVLTLKAMLYWASYFYLANGLSFIGLINLPLFFSRLSPYAPLSGQVVPSLLDLELSEEQLSKYLDSFSN